MTDLQIQLIRRQQRFLGLQVFAVTVFHTDVYKQKSRSLEAHLRHVLLANAEVELEWTLRNRGLKVLIRKSNRVHPKACLPGMLGADELFEFTSGRVIILYRIDTGSVKPRVLLVDFYIVDPDDDDESFDNLYDNCLNSSTRSACQYRLSTELLQHVARTVFEAISRSVSRFNGIKRLFLSGMSALIYFYALFMTVVSANFSSSLYAIVPKGLPTKYRRRFSNTNFLNIVDARFAHEQQLERLTVIRKCLLSGILSDKDRISFARQTARRADCIGYLQYRASLIETCRVENIARIANCSSGLAELDSNDRDLFLVRLNSLLRISLRHDSRLGENNSLRVENKLAALQYVSDGYEQFDLDGLQHALGSVSGAFANSRNPKVCANQALPDQEIFAVLRVVLSCTKMSDRGRIVLARHILMNELEDQNLHHVGEMNS